MTTIIIVVVILILASIFSANDYKRLRERIGSLEERVDEIQDSVEESPEEDYSDVEYA